VTAETKPLLDPVSERVTWDAPIHSIADIEAMPLVPTEDGQTSSPRAFGPDPQTSFAAYDYCEERGIGAYGGGQTELGPGTRGQIQYLASIFHPDTPNDVAPPRPTTSRTRPTSPRPPIEPARARDRPDRLPLGGLAPPNRALASTEAQRNSPPAGSAPPEVGERQPRRAAPGRRRQSTAKPRDDDREAGERGKGQRMLPIRAPPVFAFGWSPPRLHRPPQPLLESRRFLGMSPPVRAA